MAVYTELLQVYAVQCDGCLRRAPYAFSKRTAFGRAKKRRFSHHSVVIGANTVDYWVCKVCDTPEMQEALLGKA